MPPHAVPVIRPLTPADAPAYAALRRRMLIDTPWAFGGSPDNDFGIDAEHVAQQLNQPFYAILAAHAPDTPDTLVASVGLLRATRPKHRHIAEIWGVFVEPDHRNRGLATRLMRRAIALAREWSTPADPLDALSLAVSARTPDARTLYEHLGFTAWGREPDATRIDGESADEIHMRLDLRPQPNPDARAHPNPR